MVYVEGSCLPLIQGGLYNLIVESQELSAIYRHTVKSVGGVSFQCSIYIEQTALYIYVR